MASEFQPIPYDALVFDLGDVLFQWSSVTKTPISSKLLRTLLTTEIWFDYECNRITQDQCYSRLAQRYSLKAEDIDEAFKQAKASLTADYDLVNFIRKLKEDHSSLRIFACSNISGPDFETLRSKPADWSIFEKIFTSAGVGERKPNLGIYRHVISATGIDPRRAIFIDDKIENVFSARSIGFEGIVFDSKAAVKRSLLNYFYNPAERGNAYLQANKGKLHSVLGTTEEDAVLLHENFAQLLILEASGDRSLIHITEPDCETGFWNFFHDPSNFSQDFKDFPCDLDTTSIAYTVLKGRATAPIASRVMDQIVKNLTNDGLPPAYFDSRRPRLCAGICACVAALFYSYGRGSEIPQIVQWLYDSLLNRAYTDGTYYYVYPEYFLYAITRVLSSTNDSVLHCKFTPILKECVRERMGVTGDALALAMRIVVCNFVGIRNEIDLRTLRKLQCEDGGWEMSWVYLAPSKKLKVGNRGLATAVAISAINGLPPKRLHLDQQAEPALSGSFASDKDIRGSGSRSQIGVLLSFLTLPFSFVST
ncbi:HAD-like protein [Coprinopsis marcescibilis]|uniref:HAD-like protein n=1 Tax=Coprinopsis marcescibilis TaxID=230819 RepID=A0A5C3L880_COPMA|nr:HAD-like protein [Coprinopsis marcescibilis]